MVLKDNSRVAEAGTEPAKRYREIQRLVGDESSCFLIDLLERPGRRETDKPEIFREAPGKEVWTGNYAGVFEYSKAGRTECVTIGSRFDPEGGTGFFPQAMLEACWKISMEEYRESRADNPYDLLLTARLVTQLERAWKHGPLRAYRSGAMHDSRVRGRIDLPRQIREGMGLCDGRMAYVVREYSEKNVYNLLFQQAFLEAEKRHSNFLRRQRAERPQFRAARQALFQQSPNWERTDKQFLLAQTKKRITNPIYREYEALRVTARAVLRRMGGTTPRVEKSEPFVTGVFLDISELWELYLMEKVFKRLPLGPPETYYQRTRAILDGMLNIRPDFWWEKRRIVLDAKCKPGWEKAGRQDLWPEAVRDDVYQLLSYMMSLGCGQGGVIFPILGRKRDLESFFVSPGEQTRRFWCAGFSVPSGKIPYKTFLEGMDREAERLSVRLWDEMFRTSET